jgi:hypothetical protein
VVESKLCACMRMSRFVFCSGISIENRARCFALHATSTHSCNPRHKMDAGAHRSAVSLCKRAGFTSFTQAPAPLLKVPSVYKHVCQYPLAHLTSAGGARERPRVLAPRSHARTTACHASSPMMLKTPRRHGRGLLLAAYSRVYAVPSTCRVRDLGLGFSKGFRGLVLAAY